MDEAAVYALTITVALTVTVTFFTVVLLLIACTIGPAPPAKNTQ
jgi:hypothetical protein